MKKIKLTFMLTVFMCMVWTNALAYDIAVENADGITIYYNYIKDGAELEVTSIGRYSGIETLNIPETATFMNRTRKVTRIGDYAFSNSKLAHVTIPHTVVEIGAGAFGSSGLVSITIPNSVTNIGNYAFQNCSGLESITIGNYSAPPWHEYLSYCCTTARIALNLEFPFFMAVSAMECSLAKSSAPLSVRNPPLTFCFTFIFLTPRSLALLS